MIPIISVFGSGGLHLQEHVAPVEGILPQVFKGGISPEFMRLTPRVPYGLPRGILGVFRRVASGSGDDFSHWFAPGGGDHGFAALNSRQIVNVIENNHDAILGNGASMYFYFDSLTGLYLIRVDKDDADNLSLHLCDSLADIEYMKIHDIFVRAKWYYPDKYLL